ncbi:hypothetical protein BIY24_15420 [Halobacteriovorax marinus]|uniref:TlpA family protein disulfide reductase n=1 Tax=Halobacteriovorax marinus TaxID=97084 RepID=UPI000BC2E12B|nr:redoxin domain-containing protein [Halobacteriovorax marinus]ATH09282.1 hypothetical protein BIY24_15420 [Halobacteriovorax marinus]
MSISSKVLIITLVLGATLAYSLFEKKQFTEMLNVAEDEPVLKQLPEFKLTNFYTKEELTKESFSSTNGFFVHFWGTWCAPCEAEFPEFLKFAEKFENDNVQFLLLSVNDDDLKIKKFLKRFGDLPKNVIISHDKSGKSMNLFGTVKVPETYLFDKNFKNIKKFVGPQSWEMEAFAPRVKRLIFGQ